MKVSELAHSLGLNFRGHDAEFTGLNTLELATETEISFLANPKYTHFLSETHALAVIVSEEYADKVTNALISENPYYDFARAGSLFVKKQGEFAGISPQAYIDPTAKIGNDCIIYPFAFIGPRATIGDNCELFPGSYVGEDVTIGAGTRLFTHSSVMAGVTVGDDCLIKPGATIGTDGFGYTRIAGGIHKVPQIGSVALGNSVDIGANTCIDKATLGSTTIGSNSKVDNLVQIAHNVHVGDEAFIVSQVGIAGSTHIGNRVTLAGQVGVSGHLSIGDDAIVGPQAGVHSNISAGVRGSGSPFVEEKTYRRAAVISMHLPDLQKRIRQLEKEIKALKTQLAGSNVEEI